MNGPTPDHVHHVQRDRIWGQAMRRSRCGATAPLAAAFCPGWPRRTEPDVMFCLCIKSPSRLHWQFDAPQVPTPSPLRPQRPRARLHLRLPPSSTPRKFPWRVQIAASPDAQNPRCRSRRRPASRKPCASSTPGRASYVHRGPSRRRRWRHDGLRMRGMGARTAIMTLTRGEGGQNAMSSESYRCPRPHPHQRAAARRSYSGTEQYLRHRRRLRLLQDQRRSAPAVGPRRVLCDVVRAVRNVSPARSGRPPSPANITDGHGQHQVSGEVNQEAFSAGRATTAVLPRSDCRGPAPLVPAQGLRRVPPSSRPATAASSTTPRISGRRFASTTTSRSSGAKASHHHAFHPRGHMGPILGESYLQIAREGWGQQKSQNGGGTPPLSGPFSVDYHRYGSVVKTTDKEDSFFDGIDTSLAGIASLAHSGNTAPLVAGLNDIHHHVAAALDNDLPAQPGKDRAGTRRRLQSHPAAHRLGQ